MRKFEKRKQTTSPHVARISRHTDMCLLEETRHSYNTWTHNLADDKTHVTK